MGVKGRGTSVEFKTNELDFCLAWHSKTGVLALDQWSNFRQTLEEKRIRSEFEWGWIQS